MKTTAISLAASLPGSIAWNRRSTLCGGIAMVRDEGLTRRRQTDATERFFALCFALKQMRRNFAVSFGRSTACSEPEIRPTGKR